MGEIISTDVESVRADVLNIILDGRNEQWPSPAVVGTLVAAFGPGTTRIDTLSTQATYAMIQPHDLSQYYADMSKRYGAPVGQVVAACRLRDMRRLRVLPTMPGTHLITPRVIEALPEDLRVDTLQYWRSINDGDRPAVVRVVQDDALEEAGLESTDGVSVELLWRERGGAAICESSAALEHDGTGGLVLTRGETASVRFFQPGTPESRWYVQAFELLGAAAMSVEASNAFLTNSM